MLTNALNAPRNCNLWDTYVFYPFLCLISFLFFSFVHETWMKLLGTNWLVFVWEYYVFSRYSFFNVLSRRWLLCLARPGRADLSNRWLELAPLFTCAGSGCPFTSLHFSSLTALTTHFAFGLNRWRRFCNTVSACKVKWSEVKPGWVGLGLILPHTLTTKEW